MSQNNKTYYYRLSCNQNVIFRINNDIWPEKLLVSPHISRIDKDDKPTTTEDRQKMQIDYDQSYIVEDSNFKFWQVDTFSTHMTIKDFKEFGFKVEEEKDWAGFRPRIFISVDISKVGLCAEEKPITDQKKYTKMYVKLDASLTLDGKKYDVYVWR